jgi:LmbE family N-acetylglucosaminyl deacetylase
MLREEEGVMRPLLKGQGACPGVVLAAAVLATVAVTAGPLAAQAPPRRLLAVFAHPDDETIVGPLLARYAREGVEVHLAIATDGSRGVRAHAGIPAGEKLAAARAEEARCACRELGIHPPVLVGLPDGGMQDEGSKSGFAREVARLFADLKPDVVITWGPDGVSGHTDHRIVSDLVTEVYQSAEAPPRRLYYAGLSTERVEALSRGLAEKGGVLPMKVLTVRDRYLPVRIAYDERDAEAAARALACHASQYTPEERAALLGMARQAEGGAVALRPWFGDPGSSTDLFR